MNICECEGGRQSACMAVHLQAALVFLQCTTPALGVASGRGVRVQAHAAESAQCVLFSAHPHFLPRSLHCSPCAGGKVSRAAHSLGGQTPGL